MAQVFPTCAQENLSIIDGYTHCTEWLIREIPLPLTELSPAETGPIMAGIAGFLAVCFAGKMLLRFLTTSGSSNSND